MPYIDLSAEVLETEVVVKDAKDGHIFRFPILGNGTVSLHGARIEANPEAKRQASQCMLDAHNAARGARPISSVSQAFLFDAGTIFCAGS